MFWEGVLRRRSRRKTLTILVSPLPTPSAWGAGDIGGKGQSPRRGQPVKLTHMGIGGGGKARLTHNTGQR